MKPKPPSWIGYLMIFISAIGFGSYGLWSKLIGQEFGVFYQGWVRSALVLIILIPVAILTKSFKPVKRDDWKWVLIPVLFGVATQAPLYYAFNHMDIGTSTLVFYATFLITSYVVGRMIFKEKITLARLISLILAFVGLLLVFGFSVAVFSLLSLFLAALNGIASGGEVSTTKKSTQKFSSLQIGIYVWLGTFLTHLPLSILFGEQWIPPALSYVWFAMIGFAIAGLVSFWLVVEGYKYVDASIGGLIGLLEVIFSIGFGIVFFHESLTSSILIGGAIIIFAAMLPDLVNIWSRSIKNHN